MTTRRAALGLLVVAFGLAGCGFGGSDSGQTAEGLQAPSSHMPDFNAVPDAPAADVPPAAGAPDEPAEALPAEPALAAEEMPEAVLEAEADPDRESEPEAEDDGDCTPGYAPCIPVGADVDCPDRRQDGPRYVPFPIFVAGPDVYDLDGDGNGIACD